MTTDLKRESFLAADPDSLFLIYNEGDKRIAAQMALMVAGDARASGILAASVALAGAGFAMAAGAVEKPSQIALVVGAAAFAVTASFCAVMALAALWPTSVDVQGWDPALFVEDVAAKDDIQTIRAEMCCQISERIERNRLSAAKLTRRIRAAMVLLACSPLVGFASGSIWLVAAPIHH